MKLYKNFTNDWNVLWTRLNNPDQGVDVGEGYTVCRDGIVLTLRVSPRNTAIMRVHPDATTWCCGVMQLGNFWEMRLATPVPDAVLDEYFKIIASTCRNMFRKGIIQAWFYKQPRATEFEHPNIRKMFIKNGMRKIGRSTFNPNSGNHIQGYQASLPKGSN